MYISGNDRIYVCFYAAVRASECVFCRHRRGCCCCFCSLSLVRSYERKPLNKLSDVVFGVFILSIRLAPVHTYTYKPTHISYQQPFFCTVCSSFKYWLCDVTLFFLYFKLQKGETYVCVYFYYCVSLSLSLSVHRVQVIIKYCCSSNIVLSQISFRK